MARTFRTCSEHEACQVEDREGYFYHHPGQLQPRSPNSPEGRKQHTAMPVAPAYWETFKRWRARQGRKWKRRLS